jgi:transcriptional regulator with XRE-family HTH domain
MTKSSLRASVSAPVSAVSTASAQEESASASDALTLAAEGEELGAAELTRRVAEMVRVLRKSRGYSLDDLAQRSGVSRASLSQIETAKTNPTIAILWKISAALGVSFATLLGQERAERVRVLRRADQQVLRSADGRMESRPLTPASSSPNVEVYELRLQPRSIAHSEPHAKGTTETLIVLAGSLKLKAGDEAHELAAGDAVFFLADVAHSYENTGRIEARYHNVITYAR